MTLHVYITVNLLSSIFNLGIVMMHIVCFFFFYFVFGTTTSYNSTYLVLQNISTALPKDSRGACAGHIPNAVSKEYRSICNCWKILQKQRSFIWICPSCLGQFERGILCVKFGALKLRQNRFSQSRQTGSGIRRELRLGQCRPIWPAASMA